jgi:hypothetical protein
VSKDEALQYLKLRGIDGKLAADIYELVGGRMIHLKSIADDIEINVDFQSTYSMLCGKQVGFSPLTEIRKRMLNSAEYQLEAAEVTPHSRYHKNGAAVIRELLKEGSISREAYFNIVGREIGHKLLVKNVFAHHFDSNQVTFQSTLVRRYCEEQSASWRSVQDN